jgi:hypothetical protein
MLTRMKRLLALVCILTLSTVVSAQWIRYPDPRTPRTADGKPNLTAPAPHGADGKPDLSGIWEVEADTVMPTDGRIRSKYMYNIAADLPDGAPFQPWARALHADRQKALGVGGPSERCLPHGIPDAMVAYTLPFKIVQHPGLTIILYEEFNHWRQVFTDGRPLPDDPNPAWLGYSIGTWDGDDFVITTGGFNDLSWLDAGGTPHTEALRTTERLRRVDFGHMRAEFTFDDPKAYTRPWSATVRFHLLPDTDLLEHVCDNEKWSASGRSTPH